ncbi:MAG TPA: energy transducer TonB [Gemmatimonadales bacterium]|nr:energy transducer TonB [Gemmatimonadales bacterium]
MFENLIESKQKAKRTVGQTAVSVVVHAALIFAAVKATQGVAETMSDRPVDTTMVFLKPPEPPPPPPEQPPPDVVVAANPPPKGFQTVVAPTDIPKDIPPIDLSEKPFDPKDFTGKGVEGGIAKGIVGGTGPVVSGEVFLEAQLDDPVQPISIPTPRYPPVLQSAGIAGSVDLQYVVDTTGHAETGSFKVLKSTHPAFVEPAKEAISKGVFKPAKFKGQPVRQLVQQRISFKVGQ